MNMHLTEGGGMHYPGKRMGIIVLLSLLMLSLTLPAGARRPGHGGFGSSGFAGLGPEGRFVGNVLEQLIFPCRTSCVDLARTCYGTAETTALACTQTACQTEIATAQTTCAADRTSQACQDAVSDLRTCSDACLDTLQVAVTECRDTLGDCRAACDSTQ
jgi:hypothetical protein